MRNRGRIIGAAAAVIVIAAVSILISMKREPSYDSAFDTSVAEPAYRSGGPVVLYDEGHLEAHTADGGYRPFAQLVRNDGYGLRVARERIDALVLSGVSILVIVGARGKNDAGDEPAFSDEEAAAIETWVRRGGGLLLVTDHWPYGTAVASLAQRFGVDCGKGLAEDPDPADHHPELGESHIVFSRENGSLRDHAIVRGRGGAEEVHRVLTFSGQSLAGPPEATAFMALSPSATEREPTAPDVERSGGDVRVTMEYGEAAPAGGRAQGLALEVDRGRVVVLADAGMLRAQRERRGSLVGMNVPGYDNRQLALNIVRWLSRTL